MMLPESLATNQIDNTDLLDITLITPVILCGGSGERLWPLSRSNYPKQFHALLGGKTIFQETLLRTNNPALFRAPLIIANKKHQYFIENECEKAGINDYQLLLEPCGRNTAPAIISACLEIIEQDPEGTLLVLPSDHFIQERELFWQEIEQAISNAAQGDIVIFGITPSHAETEYGYIEPDIIDNSIAKRIHRFVEKPNLEKAEKYFQSGNFFWNSGILLLKANDFLNIAQELVPDILSSCQAAMLERKGKIRHIDEEEFSKSPSISVDYAILEKCSYKVKMVKLDLNWSDLGNWNNLASITASDADGNNIIGNKVIIHQTKNCYIKSDDKLITVAGLEDVVIINTGDSLLISSKSEIANIREVISKIKDSAWNNHLSDNGREIRPWGDFTILNKDQGYQIKKITVKPGRKLSLQSHQKRSEHWVIIKGTALVTLDDTEKTMHKNDSIYIPIGAKHRIENIGQEILEIIELQLGDYLEEDDIIRFADDYGR